LSDSRIKQNNMKKTFKNLTAKRSNTLVLLAASFLFAGVVSCEKTELPDTDSIPDLTPPSAGFNAIESNNYLIYDFSNTSKSATDYTWNFGDGSPASTEKNPEHEFATVGTYRITLVASDKKLVSDTYSADLVIVEPPAPAITPEIQYGGFNESSSTLLYAPWKPYFSSVTASSNPFNGSADGEYVNYNGSESSSKTRGAKYDRSGSANEDGTSKGSGSRFAKQAITISPERDYWLEYSYANQAEGKMVVSILDGHFPNGDDAYASANGTPLAKLVGEEVLGKGNFTKIKTRFVAPSTGLVTIWMYGYQTDQGWIDNVKVYPVQ